MRGQIAGGVPGLFIGTINAAGTLSDEIDLGEASLSGLLWTTTAVNGTLGFQVSAYSDDDTVNASNYVTLNDEYGSAIAYTLPSGTGAIRGDKLTCLYGYRYIKIKSTPAQTNGLAFKLPTRP